MGYIGTPLVGLEILGHQNLAVANRKISQRSNERPESLTSQFPLILATFLYSAQLFLYAWNGNLPFSLLMTGYIAGNIGIILANLK